MFRIVYKCTRKDRNDQPFIRQVHCKAEVTWVGDSILITSAAR